MVPWVVVMPNGRQILQWLTRLLVVGWIVAVAFVAVGLVEAEERTPAPQNPLAAEVPDWTLQAPPRPVSPIWRHVLAPPEDVAPLRARRTRPTTGQRWSEFEREFGIHEPSESLVLGAIQSAKYQLDKTVFALDLFVEQTREALQFEYDFARGVLIRGAAESEGTAPAARSGWWGPAFGEARLRSDVDLELGSGRAWVGMRLVVPMGP